MGRQQQPARRVMRVLAELREREREREREKTHVRTALVLRWVQCCPSILGTAGRERRSRVEGSTWPGRWRHGVVKKGDLVDESDTKQYRTVEYDYNLYAV